MKTVPVNRCVFSAYSIETKQACHRRRYRPRTTERWTGGLERPPTPLIHRPVIARHSEPRTLAPVHAAVGIDIFQQPLAIVHFLSSQSKADPTAFLSGFLLQGWGYRLGSFRRMTPVGSRYMRLVIRAIEVYFPVRLESWLGCYSGTNSISHNELMQ